MGEETSHQDWRIDYVEFNVADIPRPKKFCGQTFGWTFSGYGPTYCEFSDGHMKSEFDASEPATPGGPLVILHGSDLTDILDRIEAAGGKIAKPIFEFPGGRRSHFTDPDGYELAVWAET